MNSDNLRSVDQTVNCVFQVFSWATGETVHRYGRHCKRHYSTEEIEPMLTSGKHFFRCWSKQLPLEELFLLTLRPQPVVVEGKGRKQELTSVCCTTLWESCNVLFFFPLCIRKVLPCLMKCFNYSIAYLSAVKLNKTAFHLSSNKHCLFKMFFYNYFNLKLLIFSLQNTHW